MNSEQSCRWFIAIIVVLVILAFVGAARLTRKTDVAPKAVLHTP